MSRRRPRGLAFLALLTLLTACGDPTGPRPALGTYRLVSINGVALPSGGQFPAESGILRLRPLGFAERRVLYRMGPAEHLLLEAAGSYRVRGDTIELALQETADYIWRVKGFVEPGAIILRYPAPGDGFTVERFEQ